MVLKTNTKVYEVMLFNKKTYILDERIVNVNICKSKLQKRICRTVGPALAASLEPLAHRRVFSKGIILVDVQLKWLN